MTSNMEISQEKAKVHDEVRKIAVSSKLQAYISGANYS